MLSSFQNYKKPITKEEEKEEFDALYQMLQSMVRRPFSTKPTSDPSSSNPPSSEEGKNEIIIPSIIKEEYSTPPEIKNMNSNKTLDDYFTKKEDMNTSMISDDIPLSDFSNMFEVNKEIHDSGSPSMDKEVPILMETDKERKKRERLERKKEREERKERKKKKNAQEGISEDGSTYYGIELPKSMRVTHEKPLLYPNGVICKCCMASFPQNIDYLLHFNTSEICMKVMMEPLCYQPRHEITKPLHIILDDWLSLAISDGKNPLTCRHCGNSFSNIGNINKHLYTSITCNRIAYIELKKIVAEY
jgi:hypothetical protein